MIMWLVHGGLLAALLTWMARCDFSPLYFVVVISYPALALTKIRSFLEHRAADDPLARSVINEAGLLWRLLFLNLNYHSVHHDLPGVPWYGLRKSICWSRSATSSVTTGSWCAAMVSGCAPFSSARWR
jgi:fatty acid desaturase